MPNIISLLTLVIGAIGGAIGAIAVSFFTHRQNINAKVLEQYFEIRKLISKEIAPLTNIDLSKSWQEGELRSHRDKVAILYYEHYDLLPEKVLEALMLLEMSIGDARSGPLKIQDGNVEKMDSWEIEKFVTHVTFFRSSRVLVLLSLQSEERLVRENQTIKLHARNVLHAMNEFSSINATFSLRKELTKRGAARYLSTKDG
jgi:hypothetical protein